MHDSEKHRHRHTHSHGRIHRHHRTETPAAARKRKRSRAAAFAGTAAVLIIGMWLVLQKTEGLLAEKRAEIVSSGTENEETELVIPRKVRGKVRLQGTTYTYDHVIETWLLIGTDHSGNEQGEGEEYHGTMADFLMLAVFDRTDKTYGFLQLDRNTMTDVTMLQPDGTGYASADMPLCTAHWYGGTPDEGCENTVDAVSRLLGGLKIDGYYSLGMDDISGLNHAVGGVEVTIEDDFSATDPTLKMGERILLNDEQAFHYTHDRMDVGDGTNKGRMRRQRQYLKGFMEKAMEKTKEQSSFINDLYRDLKERAVTTMTDRDLSRLMNRVDQSENIGTYQIEGESTVEQFEGDGLYHARFYPDEDSIVEVLTELYHLEEK